MQLGTNYEQYQGQRSRRETMHCYLKIIPHVSLGAGGDGRRNMPQAARSNSGCSQPFKYKNNIFVPESTLFVPFKARFHLGPRRGHCVFHRAHVTMIDEQIPRAGGKHRGHAGLHDWLGEQAPAPPSFVSFAMTIAWTRPPPAHRVRADAGHAATGHAHHPSPPKASPLLRAISQSRHRFYS